MTPVSVVMIVKNEESIIRRCLKAAAWADEIVVLDTGSSDNTPQICKELGAKVFYLDKWEGFGKARQKACALASNDWILSLDADEVVSDELAEKLKTLREAGLEMASFRIRIRSHYLGKAINYCGWQKETHIRFFNRNWAGYNDALVHESLISRVPVKLLPGMIDHHTYPTRERHLEKMRFYGALGARKLFASGKRTSLAEGFFRAGFTFIKMYLLKLGFLDGWHGFELCKTTAWGTWYKYYLLWKMQKS
jgi:(heptosyl)LPS beta-1,4-glucosyltransferase